MSVDFDYISSHSFPKVHIASKEEIDEKASQFKEFISRNRSSIVGINFNSSAWAGENIVNHSPRISAKYILNALISSTAEILGEPEFTKEAIEITNRGPNYFHPHSPYRRTYLDSAMFAKKDYLNQFIHKLHKDKGPGGIDLNPAQMSMQVKKEGQDFKFNFNGTEINAAQVSGGTFTIRTITPVKNLPQALGLNIDLADKSKQPI